MPETYVYSFTTIPSGDQVPLVPIAIVNPDTGQRLMSKALLDTGAEGSCFPSQLAIDTGHDLKHKDVETVEAGGVGGKPIKMWRHTFRIQLLSPDYKDIVWRGRQGLVNCVDHSNIYPLLGYREFLRHFRITFSYQTGKIIVQFP